MKKQAKAALLRSSEPFSVGGTRIRAWASHKPNSSWR